MTNLVVCCDGTWKRADDVNVSNIERIARSVADTGPGGELQIVHYSAGVGTGGSGAERLLGGALGIGLDSDIVDAYRFLALHYKPGDAIYVFGFSRGAYTARSLIGMIEAVGLLTPDGVAAGYLPEALALYRSRPVRSPRGGRVWLDPRRRDRAREFRRHCRLTRDVTIRFLGVFDTVGALGIPGLRRRKFRFHDVRLTPMVRTARQALALADRRRNFTPCLWAGHHPDMIQAWFDGVHSDVGGGYPQSAIADDTLVWMVHEASTAGLRFDLARIRPSLHPTPVRAHNSMTLGYRLSNRALAVGSRLRRRPTPRPPAFVHGWRHPAPAVDEVLASGLRALTGDELVAARHPWNLRVARPAYGHLTKAPWRWPVNPNVADWIYEVAEAYQQEPGNTDGFDGALRWVLLDVPAWPASDHDDDWLTHERCASCAGAVAAEAAAVTARK